MEGFWLEGEETRSGVPTAAEINHRAEHRGTDHAIGAGLRNRARRRKNGRATDTLKAEGEGVGRAERRTTGRVRLAKRVELDTDRAKCIKNLRLAGTAAVENREGLRLAGRNVTEGESEV